MTKKISNKTISALSALLTIVIICLLTYSINNMLNGRIISLSILILGVSTFSLLGLLYWNIYGFKQRDSITRTLTPQVIKVIEIIIFSLFFIQLYLIYKSIYIFSIYYYIIAAIIGFLLFLNIVCIDISRDGIVKYKIIFLIIIFSIMLRAGTYLINPNLVGLDSYYHFNNIQLLISEGVLSESFYHYYYFPTYYLLYGIAGIIGIFNETTYYLLNIFYSLSTILITYSITYHIFKDLRISLTACLLCAVSSIQLFVVYFTQGKIAGLVLTLLVLFLLINKSLRDTFVNKLLIWIILIPLFFYHPETSLPIIFLLCGFLLSDIIYQMWENHKFKLLIPSLFNFSLITYIILYLYQLFFLHKELGIVLTDLFFGSEGKATMFSIDPLTYFDLTTTYILQYFFSYIGLSFLFFFLLIQTLSWIKNIDKKTLFLLSTLVTFCLLPILGIITNKFTLGAERSLIGIISIVTILAAKSFYDFFGQLMILNNRKFIIVTNIVILILLLSTFIFFSVSSHFTGDGNTIFKDEIPRQSIIMTVLYQSYSNYCDKYLSKEYRHSLFVDNKNLLRKDNRIYYNGEQEICINVDEMIVLLPLQRDRTPFYPSTITLTSPSNYHDKWDLT